MIIEGHTLPLQERSNYTCRFCGSDIHLPSVGCGCSREVSGSVGRYHGDRGTSYMVCNACADEFDKLYDDSRLSKIHKFLVRRADMDGRHCEDY